MAVQPVPEGYGTVTPYLIVNDAAAALEFYKKAFGAVEELRVEWPGGKIGHAEFLIGDSRVMLASEFPEIGAVAPTTVGGTSVTLAIYTEDVDAMFARALEEGAKEDRPVENQFYGDRSGTIIDPFGHKWSLSTHIEDVSPEELWKRQDAIFRKSDGGSDS